MALEESETLRLRQFRVRNRSRIRHRIDRTQRTSNKT